MVKSHVLLVKSKFWLVKSPFWLVKSPFWLVKSPFWLVKSPCFIIFAGKHPRFPVKVWPFFVGKGAVCQVVHRQRDGQRAPLHRSQGGRQEGAGMGVTPSGWWFGT